MKKPVRCTGFFFFVCTSPTAFVCTSLSAFLVSCSLYASFASCLSLAVCLLCPSCLSLVIRPLYSAFLIQKRYLEGSACRRASDFVSLRFLALAPRPEQARGLVPRFTSSLSPSICSAGSGRRDVFELDSRAHGCHGDLRTRGDAQDAKDGADMDLDRSFCQS